MNTGEISINAQNKHHQKMVVILTTSDLSDGVNYALEYKKECAGKEEGRLFARIILFCVIF